MDKVVQNIRNKTFCGRNETKICKWLKECNSCIVEMEKCTALPEPGSGYDCSKKTFEMKDNYFISTIPNNGSSGERRRNPRHAETCMYPNGMQTSSLSFLKYPSSIWVKQKCIFGHTFKDGISREMRCEYSEDKWKPNGFEECQPFIDCTITMITTGSSKCATGTIESAPYCNISCDRYEDKPAVPERTYECQIYGAWKPKLPYCAKAGSDIELVPAPNIKLHTIEEKPIPGKLKKPPRVYRKP